MEEKLKFKIIEKRLSIAIPSFFPAFLLQPVATASMNEI